ncbi:MULTISPECIES: YafY family protein [unclassified Kaistella]|uniref:helix-turn-helix transcriptional regulator n=1 Tax=unclassified Kaistella TaxID=2762626 RepID=UPI00273555AF|nr:MULTISPECIES: WYL domain-containing protein [unclassified Kaistella]MDP2455131.1 WYL domain-containing protein [Kaistella sp. SH11-4b]MDP2458038.1 WYL domain-containing protein [Kaistella sp. SH40-3]MDP2461005.1 WYL domain-containing protein [Kaistella sp. SH19-2b]
MSLLETFTRHRIIIQKLRMKPFTFEELKAKLNIESDIIGGNYDISIRTFQRDIRDISQLYSIDISYNKSTKRYEIYSAEDDQYSERLFEAFDVFQALKAHQEFSDYVQFDTRKPEGTGYMADLLVSIKDRKQIQVTYQKFWSEKPEIRVLEPYLLKEFRRRWYVFSYDLKVKDFRVFGLDRINNLLETGVKFQYPQSIDPKEQFKEVFGIIGSSADFTVQVVTLSFRKSPTDTVDIPNQGEYIKSMPLHASQEIVKDTPDEIVVKVSLKPNWEFIMEILSYGEYVEVLEPQSLRVIIQQKLMTTLSIYNKK